LKGGEIVNESLIHLPVRVAAERVTEENQDDVLEMINRHTLEPVTLDEIFTFSGVCSNDRMDSYLTRMDPKTTLRNYAEDLSNGVSLQEGHDISTSPYGRSYHGEMLAANEEKVFNEVRGHWYIMKDMNVNGLNTNDRIRSIKAGITKDMSVGFGGNEIAYRCSSCHRDLLNDWECTHIPGLEDENGRMTFAWIENARLREVSTVYKGATPGAYIDKARAFVQQGELSQINIMRLEREFQVRLDNGNRSFFMEKKEDKPKMNLLEEMRKALKDNKLEKGKVYELLTEEGEPFRQPDDIALRNELGELANVSAVRQLKKEAQQGRRYLADTIDQAVAMRVKAQGDTFNAESYRSMLTLSADIDHIKDEIDSYEKMAKERFKAGRQTKQEEIEEKEEEKVRTETFMNSNLFDEGDE
jgi:hypothetical protein